MSNPGVLYLAQTFLSSNDNFRIEDNIGESIHVHLGEIRIDFTISEFLEFSNDLEKIFNSMFEDFGIKLKEFDPYFFFEIAHYFINLEKVEIHTIFLKDIEVYTMNRLSLPVVRNLEYSRVYKALNGDNYENDYYKQENKNNITNNQRIVEMINSLNQNGYPHKGQRMIFFNNQNIIRDGQHRASCMLHMNGNIEVPILRLKFTDNQYSISKTPWKDKLFRWNKRRIISFLRKIKHMPYYFKKRIKWKIIEIFNLY